MTAPAHRIRYTYAEYVALEATSNVKHEFLEGQIYAMAGGTPEHAALAAAVMYVLVSHRERAIDVWSRGEDDTWTSRRAVDGELAELSRIGATLDARDLYEAASDVG